MVRRRQINTPRRKALNLKTKQKLCLNLWTITQDDLLSMSRKQLLALACTLELTVPRKKRDGRVVYVSAHCVKSNDLRYHIMNKLVELREADSKLLTPEEKRKITLAVTANQSGHNAHIGPGEPFGRKRQ